MSIRSQFGGVVTVLVCLLVNTPGWAQEQNAAQWWTDFNHYVLIARPDLAQAAGQNLLDKVDAQQLLDAVEASDYADTSRVP